MPRFIGLSARTFVGLLLFSGFAGCTPAPRADEAGFQSENPAAKLYAIHEAGDAHRAQDIPELIAALDSDDPAVRMFSIKALEEITGKRYGYSSFDPPYRRRVAVDRWVEAYESGQLTGVSESPSSQPAEQADKHPS